MPAPLPNPLTDGTTAFGSQVKANDDALAGKFTEGSNGISDADIYTGAAIKGTKLSSVSGSRIPTDRIEDDAIDSTKLRDDTSVDGNRAVTTDHIRNLAVTPGKLANDAVVRSKLKTVETLVVCTGTAATIGASSASAWDLSLANPATGVTVTNPVQYNTNRPIGVLRFRNGVPNANFDWNLMPDLQRDTATEKLWLVVHNTHPSIGIQPNGQNFLVLSVPVS